MEFLTEQSNAGARAASIRLLVLDVDGVLTGGELLYSSEGQELKQFNILDGLGIKLLQRQGIEVAIISGRHSPMLTRRSAELDIRHVVQGREDKGDALRALAAETETPLGAIAYMGDDLPDLAALRMAGLGITVPNGHPLLRRHAHLCTGQRGGQGAVREVADYLLQAQDRLDAALSPYL